MHITNAFRFHSVYFVPNHEWVGGLENGSREVDDQLSSSATSLPSKELMIDLVAEELACRAPEFL
jgi:hypothetical protein